MEPQKASHSNSDPEKEERRWRNHVCFLYGRVLNDFMDKLTNNRR